MTQTHRDVIVGKTGFIHTVQPEEMSGQCYKQQLAINDKFAHTQTELISVRYVDLYISTWLVSFSIHCIHVLGSESFLHPPPPPPGPQMVIIQHQADRIRQFAHEIQPENPCTHPSLGHAQYSPTTGHAQYSPITGHAQYSPITGHAQYSPITGHAQYSLITGHAQYSPITGHSQYSPIQCIRQSPQAVIVQSEQSKFAQVPYISRHHGQQVIIQVKVGQVGQGTDGLG